MLAGGLIDRLRARNLYSRWSRPKKFDYNLLVIGAGSAGLVSAYIGATVKARVLLVEKSRMGGDCLNTGCVPSKALIHAARLAAQMRQAQNLGLEPVQPVVDFPRVMRRLQSIIERIEPHDSIARYTALGVDVREGHAQLLDPWRVRIEGADGRSEDVSSRAIVIATGAEPIVPPLPGIEDSGYLTTETLWQAFADRSQLPQRLLILGGGPVGCELAQAFQRLGSQVTLVQRAPRLLTRDDAEAAQLVADKLRAEGVDLRTGCEARRFEQASGIRRVIVAEADEESVLEYDDVICALGRRARLEGFGLEALGIPTGKTIATNNYLQCLYPNIYAAGDVAGPYQFTHFASHQAWYAAVNALFGEFKTFAADYSLIPRVTYTDPQVAQAGLTEADAKAQGIAVEITRFDLEELDRAITDSASLRPGGHGFVKVLTVPGSDRILGVTIAAEQAGEMLPEFVLAMKHKLGLNKILGTIHAYPGWSEANKYAAGEWKRNHAPQSLLRWIERYHNWKRR